MIKNTMKKTNILTVCAGIFLIMCVAGMSMYAQAQEENVKKPKILKKEIKNIQGEVTWIGKNKIAITYSHQEGEELEMLLPFDKDVTLEHINDLGQVKQGDIVHVQYEEATQETPEGSQLNRKAKVIGFVAPSNKKPIHQQTEPVAEDTGDEESGTLKSQ